jgi:hypothetical protein
MLPTMPTAEKPVRQSVTLPADVARRVRSLAKTGRTSSSRVLVELIETGLDAKEREKERFLKLADRLVRSKDADEQERLKAELARMTFGD